MSRGFSLVEVIIVSAVLSLFFGGLFVTLQTSLKLITESRAKMSALSIANDQVEYIRSLSYADVGTINGLPPGVIPQVSTTTLNGIVFNKRTLVEYVDDPADGLGSADSNNIQTDYKQVKAEISWLDHGAPRSVFLTSNIVPRSIETDVGGGTVRVNVYNANTTAVSGASVRLQNTSGTSTVDVTKYTDSTGVVLFGGAPARAGYQVTVTKAGYSTDKTYQATSTLPNPVSQPFAVAEDGITSTSFFIDKLSQVNVRLLSNYTVASTTFTFASSNEITSATNTEMISNSLRLTAAGSNYAGSGTAELVAVSPTPLASWEELVVNETLPNGTSRRIKLYDRTNHSLISDSILPGNSTGLVGNIDLRGISAIVYPSLLIEINLQTTNATATPQINELSVYYRDTEGLLSNQAFVLTGSKIIGTDNSVPATPVYKTKLNATTDGVGERLFSTLEWDTYTLGISGYTIKEACGGYPLVVAPGRTFTAEYTLAASSENNLRVIVKNSLDQPIRGATISLIKAGSVTNISSSCGQVYFGNLINASDYQLQVSAPGYSPVTIDPVSVSGQTVTTVTL